MDLKNRKQINLVDLLLIVIAFSISVVISYTIKISDNILIPVAFTVGIVSVVSIISQQKLGLWILIFVTYTRFSDVLIEFHGAPSVAKYFVVFLLGVIILRWIILGENPEGLNPAWLFFLLFILLYSLSLFFAADVERVIDILSDLIKDTIIAVVIITLVDTKRTIKQIVWVLILVGLFLGSIAVFQYLTGSFGNNFGGFSQANLMNIVGQENDYRISGPIGDPNFFAQIMVVIIPLALDRVWREKNWVLRAVALWSLVVSFLTIMFTFSRGGFLALLLTLGMMIIYYKPPLKNVLVMLILGIGLFQNVPDKFLDRFATLSAFLPSSEEAAMTDNSFRGRTSELKVGINTFKDYPVLGVGVNNYNVHYIEYSQELGIDARYEDRSAHNLYVEIAAEQGLAGLSLFFVTLFVVYRNIYTSWESLVKSEDLQTAGMIVAFSLGFLGYLFSALFVHDAYPRYFWLLLGIAFAIPKVVKSTSKSKELVTHA